MSMFTNCFCQYIRHHVLCRYVPHLYHIAFSLLSNEMVLDINVLTPRVVSWVLYQGNGALIVTHDRCALLLLKANIPQQLS